MICFSVFAFLVPVSVRFYTSLCLDDEVRFR